MGEPKLTVRALTKRYGAVVALERADLEVRPGEFLTLLGPSGSGKTTLLMIVAGLLAPDEGEVWIDGQPVTYAPSYRRDVGMVFQNYALFPHLSVYENIAFPLRMRRVPDAVIADKVQRILEVVRLPDVAHRLPRELSGGQQQRIALARCTVYEPSIVLMDEPLGALDKRLRDQMKLEIKQLHAALGTTIVYVTHDQEEAMMMSDRICLMDAGRIQQLGTPRELYFEPATVFVADFLGDSNLFVATVEDAAADPLLLRGPGDMLVRAAPRRQVHPGERVKYLVRPESLRLVARADETANVLHGRLVDAVMAGGITKYFVTLPDGSVATAIRLTEGGEAAVKPGDQVALGWDVEQTVVLPS